MTSPDDRSHAGSRQDSLVEILSRISGPLHSVLLRDEPSEVGTSPVVDAAACRDLPRLLGRTSYQVLGEIGRGGMGVVLKAHDADLGRDIAMKVMHPGYATDPMFLQRFVEEAQLGGQLQHPGIVPVYEMGLLADERPFFTMKLVKGRTLADLLRGEPAQDRARLLSIFESVCLTVGYAHSRRVIHRDLKPSNVMVGAFGEVQVVDWGLAKVIRRSASSDKGSAPGPEVSVIETVRSSSDTGSDSVAGSVMGTPQYMSPEQARGEIEALDERSDVFCLGSILAEILTGRPPYAGPREHALDQARRADLGSVRQALCDCGADAALVELCLECLSPVATSRPAEGHAVAQRIHDHQASMEERKRRATVAAVEARVSAQEDRKVRRLTVGLAAMLLLIVVLGGGGWAWLESERSARRREITARVEQSLVDAAYERGAGNWVKARSAAREAEALLGSLEGEGDRVARTRDILEEIEEEIASQDRQAKLEESNRSLLAALREIRQPHGKSHYAMELGRLQEAYGQAFWDHGLVVEGEREEVVAGLRERGAPVELAAALDEWATVRRLAGLDVEANEVSDIARLLDPDEYRCRVRDAIVKRDQSELVSLASSERLDSLPPGSLGLLARALGTNEAIDLSIATYRRGLARSPDDFALHMGIARVLKDDAGPSSDEAVMHY